MPEGISLRYDVKFHINEHAMEVITHSLGGPTYKAVEDVIDRIATEARLECPVDTGHLRDSIEPEMRVGARVEGAVVARASYAMAVHEGYTPNNVRFRAIPKGTSSAKARRMMPKSRAKAAAVPGRPFLRDAMTKVVGNR